MPHIRSTMICRTTTTVAQPIAPTAPAVVMHATKRAGMWLQCSKTPTLLHPHCPATVAALSATLLAGGAGHAWAAEVQQVFQASCAGCHAGGGNVVQAGATLKLADLQRNGVADPDALFKVIYSGRGKMPGYGKECTPKVRGNTKWSTTLCVAPSVYQGKCTFGPRLSDEEIQSLTTYILEQAEAGWTSP